MSLVSLVNRQGLSVYFLALGCLLLGPWNDGALGMLGLETGPLRSGEYWRFWTGQMVHLSWAHLGLNLLGLIVLQQLFGAELRPVVWLWGFAVISLTIGVCFLAFSRFGYVVGLSALLHGLLAYGACLAMRRDGLLASGVLLVIAAKLIWELFQGPSSLIEDMIGLPVAADTHMYGFAGGLLLGVVMVVSARRN